MFAVFFSIDKISLYDIDGDTISYARTVPKMPEIIENIDIVCGARGKSVFFDQSSSHRSTERINGFCAMISLSLSEAYSMSVFSTA